MSTRDAHACPLFLAMMWAEYTSTILWSKVQMAKAALIMQLCKGHKSNLNNTRIIIVKRRSKFNTLIEVNWSLLYKIENEIRWISYICSTNTVFLTKFVFMKYVEGTWSWRPLGNCPTYPFLNPALLVRFAINIGQKINLARQMKLFVVHFDFATAACKVIYNGSYCP